MPKPPVDARTGDGLVALLSAAEPIGLEPIGAEAAAAARALGFDPEGSFCVAALAGGGSDVSIEAVVTVVATSERGSVVVAQDVDGTGALDAQSLADVLAALHPDAVAGISAVRPGLDGLRLALVDAQQALALARARGNTVMWENCWWLAVLTEHLDQLDEVVSPTWTFAAANAHLTEAVEAYADESFSSTRAARRLFVHPNTVLYRLRQWHRNTGLNPSVISGLATSVAAVELGRLSDRNGSNATPTGHP